MEFSRTFRVAFLITLYLSVMAFADINEDKKNALKEVGTLYESIQKLLDDTKKGVSNSTEYVNIIKNFWIESGEAHFANTNIMTQEISKTGFLMADLLKSPADVVKCIQLAEREALEDHKAYFINDFQKHRIMCEDLAISYVQEVIKNWKNDMEKGSTDYTKLYEEAKNAINAAKDKSAISTALKDFKSSTKSMAEYVVEVYKDLNHMHSVHVDFITSYVPTLINVGKLRNDKLAEELRICFSKY